MGLKLITAMEQQIKGTSVPTVRITEEYHKSLASYCFSNLEHFLEKKKVKEYHVEFDDHNYPVFVTYYIGEAKNLRGCIGTFKSESLGKTLQSYSIIAAVKDHRFPPIQMKELDKLTCEVSLLSEFEAIAHPLDWTVGTHGIEIEFHDSEGNGPYRGTYLPHVASEQGWD